MQQLKRGKIDFQSIVHVHSPFFPYPFFPNLLYVNKAEHTHMHAFDMGAVVVVVSFGFGRFIIVVNVISVSLNIHYEFDEWKKLKVSKMSES